MTNAGIGRRRDAMTSLRIARTRHDGPDGPEPRIVVSAGGSEPWVDVRAAERLRLQRDGASAAGARRLAAAIAPASLAAALESGPLFLDAARRAARTADPIALAADGAPLLAPIDPPAYRDFMAFEEHFRAGARLRGSEPAPVLYELPVSYMGSAQAIVGPEDEVPWPAYTGEMDFELELGIVIGRPGRDVRPEAALDHVLGLTVLDDFSARDMQRREMTGYLGPSKGKHFATAVGPWIVTLDALRADDLAMTARINGKTVTATSSATMLWSLAEIVAWASAGESLVAGTLLGTGTVGGGCGMELDLRLAPGDVVELEIEGIGTLRNRVGHPAGEGWMPRPKRPTPSHAT